MSVLDWIAKNKKTAEKKPTKKPMDIPGDMWIKCFGCDSILFNNDLSQNLKVCPNCSYHFKLSAKERIEATFDKGSFKEFAAEYSPGDPLKFKDLKTYEERIKSANKKSKLNEAIVIVVAKLDTQPVVSAIMDFSYMGGSMGSVVGEKFTLAAERALEEKRPLIAFTASGGARMQEGILSLMQMAKTSAALEKLSEAKIPYIVVLTDPTTGGTTASFAMLGDIQIAERGALIAFAGPRVIEQTIRQKLPKGFQRSEYLMEHGMVDIVIQRAELRKTLSELVSILTGEK
jgi:acetyl-CoA carboxylase carboxyl transferase subunit beta